MRHRIGMAATLAVLVLLAGVLPARAFEVGFVNPQRIVSETRIGRTAQDDLARLGQEKDKRIQLARARVESVQHKLDKGGLSINDQSILEDQLRIHLREYRDLVEQSNYSLRDEERKLVRFIMKRADAIMRTIAGQRGFTMVLTDPEIIGYVDPAVDITDQVIKALDSK